MRDIGTRIQRYRLTRYAMPEDKVGRRLRWVWLIAALWLVWVGFLSDHNFYRLWTLDREAAHETRELERLRAEAGKLEAQITSEAARKRLAESQARRNGMARADEIIYRIDEKAPPRQ